ncbi:unnamed protein product [Heterobilharzia americana]|nr:unnamed protein product [Heterobilharzia americana]
MVILLQNLSELTHRAAFNLPMLERRPCLLQIVYGPYGLLASNLGASNCLHSLNRKYNNENCYSSKLIPSLNSLTGMYSPTTLSKYECGEELKTYFGCTLITYTARIQERLHTLFMSHKRKQLMLTTKNSNDQLISRSIASCYIIQPSLPIIKLTEILCSLAISPHRSDIQQFAIWLLNSYIIKFIPSIGTQVVKSMIHRLDNIIPDIKTSISLSNSTLLCSSSSSAVSSSSSSSTSSLSAATSTSSIISLDAKLKVIHRRRISIIMLLKSIYCRDLWNREYDELFRLDPNIFVQFCISLIQQLINFDKEKSIWLNNSLNNHHNDSLNHQQRQLKQLKMNRDYLENLINQILLSLKQFPVNCILYFPVNYKVDKIPSNSWVCKLYNEVDYCLNVFQYPCNIETLNTSNKFISKVFEKRREAVILFTQNISEYIVDICSNLCKNISSKEELLVDNTTHNNNSSSSSSSISWMFISTLLRFLRFPINRSLIPEWNRQSNRLIPPFIYPPSLKFIQITLELIVYQQTDVAFSACKCISRLIYHLLSYYRVPSHNLWLLYNENAKVLQSNEAYQSHHHIGSMPYGYVYYPIELYIYDPDCIMPYPVFNENKQLVLMSSNKVSSIIIDSDLKTNSIDYYQLWLSHFTANDEQNDLRQQCACLLATKLSTKNLLYIHRAYLDQPNFSFPIRFLIHVSLIAFGPENMLEHIENFIKTLLITLPNSNLPLDGKAEFIGFFWVCATLDVLINASFLWQRQWKYYFWGRMIPRILCWSEICALKVSLNDLACSIDERLHPTLKLIKWARTQYAGRFAGGRDDIDHIIIGNPEAINGNSSLPKNESSSSTMNTIHLSSSSTAGGPLHRVIFMYEYCISRVMLNVNHDVHCLHPLWDWAVQGLLDCYSNVQNNNNNSQLKISSCQHVVNKNHGITTIIEDNCPLCLLVEQLPIHHRRVFCERICHLFILSLDWIGISLYKGLISSIQNKISLTLSSYQSDIWLYQACDNSIWIRDIAAEMAAFRITCLFNIMKYKTKNCLNTIMYKSEKIEFTCLTKQLSFIDYEIVIKNLLQINDNEKLVGGDFLFNLFIPLLVRDTLNILRLKGQNISKSCTHLPEAPPEHINSSILKQIYNAISNNKELIKEDDRNSIDKKINCRSEMIVLSNRLFSLYTCLTFSLAKQYPIYSKERQDNNIVENCMHQLNLTCYTNICQWLMPLIADVCSINNAYDYLILSLNMNIFQDNSSLSIKDYLNKELDGLYFGLSSYLLDFSTLALSGQQQYNIENVLYSIEQFIQYFLKHESWRTRVIGLLLFRNLIIFNLSAFHTIHYNNNNTNNNNDKYENSSSSSLNNITIEQIINKRLINILWDCLNDPFLEVCHTAMFVMAVFIEINLIKYDAKWIDDLVKQMNRPLPKSINQSLSNTIQTGNRLTNDHDYQSPIRSRYTAILALCSFIHGHPHTTPDYLPFIISELTNHIHDPQPIKKVITSTISAYSRSHQDVWHEQSLKFTPEQLDNYKFVISNVSYYV